MADDAEHYPFQMEIDRTRSAVAHLSREDRERVLRDAAKPNWLLDNAKVGDQIVFDSGMIATLTVIYGNGPGYFIRWKVPGKAWSETDKWCCGSMRSPDGKYGQYPSPLDIVEVIRKVP